MSERADEAKALLATLAGGAGRPDTLAPDADDLAPLPTSDSLTAISQDVDAPPPQDSETVADPVAEIGRARPDVGSEASDSEVTEVYAAPTSAPTLAERVQVAGDPDHVESLAADIPASAPTPVSGMLSAPPDTGSEMPHSGMADGTSHVTPDTMPDSMPGSMPDAMEGPADQIDTTMHMDMEMGDLVIEDNNAFLMAMGEGSRIEIHAADAAKESWTQLTQNAIAGDTELHFDESTGWEIGDVIAIAPSGSDYTQDEVRTIKWISEDGKHVRLDAPLEYSHIGVIEQHTNGKTGEDFREYDVDMRAEVALLSRNVTIQGDTDDDGYGAHTMVMHGASQHISGAEFTRVGQIDELGRYPIHWHMGADVSGQYVENISIHEAYNKGVTVHGSFNARVEGNVVFDHIGHGMFTEDGSEYGNQFLGNLVFGTHRSETGQPIPTDRSHVASYWIENTNNTFVGNHAAGSEGFGFFVAPAPLPHGLSAEAYDRAEHPQIISSFSNYIFEDNAAHSAATTGYWQDGFVRADDLTWRAAGASGGNAYIEDFTAYGNGSFGMWFRGSGAYITDSALADNRVNYEFRGGRNVMHDTVVIGRSDTGRSEEYAGIPLAGVNSNEQYLGVVAGYDGTHWANYDEKIALSIRSAGSTQYTWFNNVSTEDANNFHRWKVPGKDGPVATTTKILDLDGSLTGTEGAVLTEILDESYTFRAGPGELTTLDGFRGSVMSEGGAFAQVEFMYVHPTAPSAMTLTRWDGVEYPEWAAQDAHPRTNFYVVRETLLHVGADENGDFIESAYLLEYEELPNMFFIDIASLRVGEAVLFQVPNVAAADFDRSWRGNDLVDGMETATSWEEFFASDVSIGFVTEGNLFLRIIGVPREGNASALTSWENNPSQTYLGNDGLPNDARKGAFQINILQTVDTPVAYGEAEFSETLMEWAMNPETTRTEPLVEDIPLPERDNLTYETYASTSDTETVTAGMPRWSDDEVWGGSQPGANTIIVIGEGQTVVLDQSATVKGIIVDGGELIIEDAPGGPADAITLISDYVLVINGGLFQAGTEDDPLDRDFTLELTGDDPDFDLQVTHILNGMEPGTVFAQDPSPLPPADPPADPPEDPPADPPADPPTAPEVTGRLELGQETVAQATPDQWHQVTFGEVVENAVVVMGPLTFNGNQAAYTELRNVTDTGFEFRIAEWDYDRGSHQPETVGWMAVSAGTHTLADGAVIQAGTVRATDEVPAMVVFGEAFEDAPIVFGQRSSVNDPAAATTRVSNVVNDRFRVGLQEEELADGVHAAEDVDWIALEAGSSAFQSSGFMSSALDGFSSVHSGPPASGDVVLADLQSFNGPDAADLRVADRDRGVAFLVQEETSRDAETTHASETIAYLVAQEGGFDLYA